MRIFTPLLCLLLAGTAAAQQSNCGMAPAFRQPDEGSTIAVWKSTRGAGLLFADSMHINTDGTRRSYSVDDFWGETRALNNLCNAMSDSCTGLFNDELRHRRIATQRAKADGWPIAETLATHIAESIIPFKDGKPCPEVDGFLVSATSLQKPKIKDVCEISNYADALTVPAIVLPKRANKYVPTPFQNEGAEVGDLAVLMSADSKILKYAVVGDTGPVKQLGEVSLALASDLNGRALPPKSYSEVRGKGEFKGRGWSVGKTYTLVLSRTRNDADPYMTRDRIERDGEAAFKRWGGVARLRACSASYRP